jgi:hypothetical protein
MRGADRGIQPAKVAVAVVATLLWIGTSIAVAGVVRTDASITAVNVGVPFLALLFSYHVFFHEGERERARLVAAVLALTGAVGILAVLVQDSTLTFVSNVLALLGMFGLVAFLWR